MTVPVFVIATMLGITSSTIDDTSVRSFASPEDVCLVPPDVVVVSFALAVEEFEIALVPI